MWCPGGVFIQHNAKKFCLITHLHINLCMPLHLNVFITQFVVFKLNLLPDRCYDSIGRPYWGLQILNTQYLQYMGYIWCDCHVFSCFHLGYGLCHLHKLKFGRNLQCAGVDHCWRTWKGLKLALILVENLDIWVRGWT